MRTFRDLCLAIWIICVFGCEDDKESGIAPIVTGFVPNEGFVGSLVTISGGNFGSSPRVFLNDVEMTVNTVADDQLTVTVPESATTGPIRVENNGKETTTSGEFTVTVPRVDAIQSVRAYDKFGTEVEVVSPGERVSITFAGIIPEGAKIFFNDKELINVSTNGGELLGEIPQDVHTGKFKVVASGVTKTYDKEVSVIEGLGTWTLDAAYPGGIIPKPVNFGIGDYFYYGIGEAIPASYGGAGNLTQEFYEFDLAASKWSQMPSFPSKLPTNVPTGVGAFSFAIGDLGYACGGSSPFGIGGGGTSYKFFRFDPSIKTWTELDTLSSNVAMADYGFSVANRGFAIDLETALLFEYDVAADTFKTKGNVPFATSSAQVRHIELDGKAYFVVSLSDNNSTTLWQYDPAGDSWTSLAGLPYLATIYVVAIDGKAYVGSESWFARYDGSGTFTRLPPPPVRLNGPCYNRGKSGYIFDTNAYSFPEQGYSGTYRFTLP